MVEFILGNKETFEIDMQYIKEIVIQYNQVDKIVISRDYLKTIPNRMIRFTNMRDIIQINIDNRTYHPFYIEKYGLWYEDNIIQSVAVTEKSIILEWGNHLNNHYVLDSDGRYAGLKYK